MEKCFYLKKDTKYMTEYNKFLKKRRKIEKKILGTMEQMLGINFSGHKGEIGFMDNACFGISHKLAEKYGLSKKFSVIGSESATMRDENGIYVGQFSVLKKNTKEYNSIRKIYEEFEFDPEEIPIIDTRMSIFYFDYGGYRQYYRDGELYLLVDSKIDKDKYEVLKDEAIEIKMSEFYRMLEEKEKQ